LKFIKKTTSVCPECLDVIDAEILEKEGGIWMHKECKSHGKFQGLIEKDPIFYKKTMNLEKVKNKLVPQINVAITHQCNLNCNFCYLPNRNREDMSLDRLKQLVNKLPKCSFCLTGGEPTVKENLFEFFEILKKSPNIRNFGIVTNGIRLADRDYVARLKAYDLDWIAFSFNGFRDKVYRDTNNENLLDIKLRALENIKNEKIPTVITSTLVRGLNEKDIKLIIEYVLDNSYPFSEVRIRGAAKVGRYDDIDPLCTSEMLDIVAKAIGLNRDYFLNKFPNRKIYHSANQFNLRLVFTENRGIRKLLYWDHGRYLKNSIVFSKNAAAAFFKIAWHTLLKEGSVTLIKSLFSRFGPYAIFHKEGKPGFMNKLKNTKTLDINIFFWPDRSNIDLEVTNNSGVQHITYDGELLNFKDAIIRSEEL